MTKPTKLARVMFEQGIKETELSDLSKVSRGTISAVKNGHRSPNTETLRKIAKALDVTVSDIWEVK